MRGLPMLHMWHDGVEHTTILSPSHPIPSRLAGRDCQARKTRNPTKVGPNAASACLGFRGNDHRPLAMAGVVPSPLRLLRRRVYAMVVIPAFLVQSS